MKQIENSSTVEHQIDEEAAKYIIDNTTVAILVIHNFTIKFVNPAVEILFGYSQKNIIGRSFIDFIHPEDRLTIKNQYIGRLRGENQPIRYEFRILSKEGRYRWVGVKTSLIAWQEKTAILCFLDDFTDRITVQQEHYATLQRLNDIIEFLPDATFVIDMDGKVIFWNRAIEELTGVKKEQILGRGDYAYAEAFYNEKRPILINLIFNPYEEIKTKYSFVISQGEKLIAEVFIPNLDNGNGRHLWCVASPLYNQNGQKIGAIESTRDITEKKRTDEMIRQSEERFRQIAENVNDAFWVIDVFKLKFLYTNPAMEKIYGVSFTGKSIPEIDTFIHPDDRERVVQNRKTRKNLETEFRIVRSDGGVRYVRSRAFLVKNNDGQVYRIIGITTDITVFKKAAHEAELHRQQMIQADKMASLGVLVSGVAHEINNPTNFIMLNAPLLRRTWESVAPILEKYRKENGDFSVGGMNYSRLAPNVLPLIDGIQNGANRIQQIVADLKEYARLDATGLKKEIEINKVVQSALKLLDSMCHKRTNFLSVNLEQNLPSIKGNYQRLEQVIINLVQNACEALNSKEQPINIKTMLLPDKERIAVVVTDQGEGISPENISKLTDPFFTTKRERGGTGLGLSISSGIVKDHCGSLSFDSTLGKGTVATLELPCVKPIQEPLRP